MVAVIAFLYCFCKHYYISYFNIYLSTYYCIILFHSSLVYLIYIIIFVIYLCILILFFLSTNYLFNLICFQYVFLAALLIRYYNTYSFVYI